MLAGAERRPSQRLRALKVAGPPLSAGKMRVHNEGGDSPDEAMTVKKRKRDAARMVSEREVATEVYLGVMKMLNTEH